MNLDTNTDKVTIEMPYISLVKMSQLVCDRIDPESVSNTDSIQEVALTDFMRKVFDFTDEVVENYNKEKIVKELNDNVDIPFISEKTEGKILDAVYDSVEEVVKKAILK